MKFVFIGLSISSSWGNGHATTYRGLLNALGQMGHEVVFLERDMPWYRKNRDLTESAHFDMAFYGSLAEARESYGDLVASADMVIVGSYVPEGSEVCRWVVEKARGITAFYDIDTPVTLDKLKREDHEYLESKLVPAFDLYLSFSGGKALDILKDHYHAKRAVPLYCAVDTDIYYPMTIPKKWKLGYLGTYSEDREKSVNNLLLGPCKRMEGNNFVIAGPNHQPHLEPCPNLKVIEHLPPDQHCQFYNEQEFTLNVTREPMKRLGSSPSVRLFEAAACGVPIISDYWEGLDQLFTIGEEIQVASSGLEVQAYLEGMTAQQRSEMGKKAREKVLQFHTAEKRALELINYFQESHSKTIVTE